MKRFFKIVGVMVVVLAVLGLTAGGLMVYAVSGLTEAIHEEVQAQRVERWVREIERENKPAASKQPRAKKHAKPLRHDRRRVVCGSRAKH